MASRTYILIGSSINLQTRAEIKEAKSLWPAVAHWAVQGLSGKSFSQFNLIYEMILFVEEMDIQRDILISRFVLVLLEWGSHMTIVLALYMNVLRTNLSAANTMSAYQRKMCTFN